MKTQVKILTDKKSMMEARCEEVLSRKHWKYHRLDEVADWKGGETALAKRLLKKYQVTF
jgi:hypothetical protein